MHSASSSPVSMRMEFLNSESLEETWALVHIRISQGSILGTQKSESVAILKQESSIDKRDETYQLHVFICLQRERLSSYRENAQCNINTHSPRKQNEETQYIQTY
jgi:hypothetical protein